MESGLSERLSSSGISKVLVIDDEPLVRESIAVYLEDSGYKVYEASNGRQGVELFCEFSPDVVLCDLRMPGLDGLQILKTLTQLAPRIPIIIVSGAGQIQDVVEALRLGARDYIVKPVTDMAVLENAVINAIHRYELEEQNLNFRKELDQANFELEKNLALLQQDHEAGRRAQLQLLPSPDTTINGFRFQHAIIPSANLSGDFIDYIQISERFTCFYIADVSGHGAATAFVTMTLKSLVNQPLRQFRLGENDAIIDPAVLVKYLNGELIKANLGKHISLFYAVVDCESRKLNYCVAGQYPAPLIYNQGQSRLLADGGFPVGLFEWASFETHQLQMSEDFKIIMVSDGWLELIAGEYRANGENFLLDYVTNNPIDIESLMRPIQQFSDQVLPDDVTVFIVSKE
jgi:phosphoserine phosphatase RsbU/P